MWNFFNIIVVIIIVRWCKFDFARDDLFQLSFGNTVLDKNSITKLCTTEYIIAEFSAFVHWPIAFSMDKFEGAEIRAVNILIRRD
jgi:hypothetical protein